jgi:PRD1 phage membrane DNA delivery
MSDNFINAMVAVVTSIVGLAIIATLVSRNAQTSGVISAAGTALSQDIGTAVSPVTGGSGGVSIPMITGGLAPID